MSPSANTPPAYSPYSQPKKSHVGLIIGLVVGFLLLLFVGGIIFGMLQSLNNEVKQKAATSQGSSRNSQAPTGGSSTASPDICLTADELNTTFEAKLKQEDIRGMINGIVESDNVFFGPDSTIDMFPDQTPETYDKFANFYKKYESSKKFTLFLQASAYEGARSSAGDVVAGNRANKVKSELVARGVSADRITIGEPKYDVADTSARNVRIELRNDLSCTDYTL